MARSVRIEIARNAGLTMTVEEEASAENAADLKMVELVRLLDAGVDLPSLNNRLEQARKSIAEGRGIRADDSYFAAIKAKLLDPSARG